MTLVDWLTSSRVHGRPDPPHARDALAAAGRAGGGVEPPPVRARPHARRAQGGARRELGAAAGRARRRVRQRDRDCEPLRAAPALPTPLAHAILPLVARAHERLDLLLGARFFSAFFFFFFGRSLFPPAPPLPRMQRRANMCARARSRRDACDRRPPRASRRRHPPPLPLPSFARAPDRPAMPPRSYHVFPLRGRRRRRSRR